MPVAWLEPTDSVLWAGNLAGQDYDDFTLDPDGPQPIGVQRVLPYTVRQIATKPLQFQFVVNTGVGPSVRLLYRVIAHVALPLQMRYGVIGGAGLNLRLPYKLRVKATQTLTLPYLVLTGKVRADLTQRFIVRAPAAGAVRQLPYRILARTAVPNPAAGALSAGIASGAGSFTLTEFPGGWPTAGEFVVTIGAEQLLVHHTTGATFAIDAHGINATVAAAHIAGDLVRLGPAPSTTLNGAIDNSQTAITVSSSSGFPAAPFIAWIGGELVLVTDAAGITWTVVRGYGGTTAAAHANATPVLGNGSAAYRAAGATVKVEIAYGSGPLDTDVSWTDVSSRLISATVDRGRVFELDKYEAAQVVVRLQNRDGLLDPSNAGAQVAPEQQIRITARYAGTGAHRQYTGSIERIAQERTKGDPHAMVARLECSDGTEQLANATVPVVAPAGELFYAEQKVQDRIRAGLLDGGWPSSRTFIATGNVDVAPISYPAGTVILEVIDDAVDAEFPGLGIFFIAKTGIAMFLGRLIRTDPTNPWYEASKATLGDDDACAADPTVLPVADGEFEPVLSIDEVLNDVVVYPRGATGQRVADLRVTDPASIEQHGHRADSIEVLTSRGTTTGNTASQECALFIQFLIDNYKQPQIRIPSIKITGSMASARPTTDLWDLLLSAELGNRLTLLISNPGGGTTAGEFFIEGTHLTIANQDGKPNTFELVLDLSPASYWTGTL